MPEVELTDIAEQAQLCPDCRESRRVSLVCPDCLEVYPPGDHQISYLGICVDCADEVWKPLDRRSREVGQDENLVISPRQECEICGSWRVIGEFGDKLICYNCYKNMQYQKCPECRLLVPGGVCACQD